MTLQISAEKVLEGYRAYWKEMRKPGMECLKDNFSNNSRRKAVADRFREKFIMKNLEKLEKLGVDLGEISTLQEKDAKAAKEFLQEQRLKVRQYAEERSSRQQRFRKRFPDRRTVLLGLKNPPYRRCLVLATGIFIDGPIIGDASYSDFISRTSDFDNSARIRATVNNNGACLTFIDYHFFWTAESDGILYPETYITFNGSWQRYNPSDCTDENIAILQIWTDFSVAQMDPSGEPRAHSPGSIEPLYERSVRHSGSSADTETVPILPDRDYVNLDAPRMEIVAHLPVIFTVTVGFQLASNNGADVTLDFLTEPFEINVSGVVFEVVT